MIDQVRICKIDGCGKHHVARGLCDKHYARWKTHGDPLKVLPILITQQVPLKDRFWTKVEKTESCWIWKAYKSKFGYGVVGLPGSKTASAHRAAWYLTHGEWPKLFVLHRCDNRACVNPDHLWLGTQKSNMIDCAKKGRLWNQNNPGVPYGPALENKLKTHCSRGHELAGENLRKTGKKRQRSCRICFRETDRVYKQMLRDRAKASC
jgi:HNH endonuclease